MTIPLELVGATKRYGSRQVVGDLNIEIRTGERVAVLGANGAGKSTMLRLALGLIRPSSGECRLFGLPPQVAAARQPVGYAPQISGPPDRLRVGEIIRFVRDCKGAAEPTDLIDRLGLGPLLPHMAGGLSLGQQRRLTLLLAFMGEPELVILDEPTVSLDAESRLGVWDLIREYCDAGGTLLLASHDFREVSAISQRVLLLAGGRLRADASTADLARSQSVAAVEIPRTAEVSLAEVSYVSHQADRTVLITRRPDLVLKQLGPVADGQLVQRQATVEEVYLALSGGVR